MNKKKVLLIVIAISFSLVVNCRTIIANDTIITTDKITSVHVEPYKYKRTFIIRFAKIIYYEEGKKIEIPVFQGKYENVLYKDFREYCLNNKLLEPKVRESGFMIKCKIGETRSAFQEFLKFYKSSIFKDIDIEKPTVISLSATDWIIKYDFNINGVPCYMTIMLPPREADLNQKQSDVKFKSVFEIIPKEDEKYPGFLYKIYIGSKSTD